MRWPELWAILIAAAILLGAAVYIGIFPISLAYLTLPSVLPFLGGAVAVIGALDAALKPDSAWRAADQNKVVWVGLQLGGLIAFGVPGVVAALVYFELVRPKLRTHSTVV